MTRTTHTSEETQQRLASLPEDVRNVVYGTDMDTIIRQIGLKHNLHIDQMGLLEAETIEVMLGFTKPNDFTSSVMESLEIDQQKAGVIVRDVNDMLFLKIRDSMKKVAEMEAVSPAIHTQDSATSATSDVPVPQPSATTTIPVPTVPKPSQPTQTLAPKLPEMHSADLMLTQKTASVAPVQQSTTDNKQQATGAPQSTKPQNYKADPYREPVE